MERYILLVIAGSMVAGFVGGLMSRRIVLVSSAAAEGATDVPEVVRAERFEVLDKKGKVRAILDEDGLAFRDKNEKRRVDLTQGGLRLGDEEGKVRAYLAARSLTFADENKKIRVCLGCDEVLMFSDKKRKPRVELSGGIGLVLGGENGKLRAGLIESVLWFCDENGTVIFEAPAEGGLDNDSTTSI